MFTFDYQPADGHLSRDTHPLVGYVTPGRRYTVDRNVAEALRRDPNFREHDETPRRRRRR